MTGRWAVTLSAALAGVVAGATAQAAGSPVASLAWALLAGIGLSLMLRGAGLRVLGVLLAALATASAVWSGQSGLWVPSAGFAVAGLAAAGMIVAGPRWAGRFRAAADRPRDLWQSMDAGEDPTAEHGVPQ